MALNVERVRLTAWCVIFLCSLLFHSSNRAVASLSPTESSLHFYDYLVILFFAYISFPSHPTCPIWFPVLFIPYLDLQKPTSFLHPPPASSGSGNDPDGTGNEPCVPSYWPVFIP